MTYHTNRDDVIAAAAASAKPGSISSFLKNHREATSIAHDAAVAASLNRAPIASTTTNAVRGPARQTEAELAAEVSARTGRRIEVNDDGIIIDKRELLSGGLNIIARPRTETGNGGISNAGGFAAPISARTAPNPSSTTASAANPAYPVMSAAERAQQSRERQSREIERQMIEMESRKKREAEELLEVRVAKVAKRNDSSKVEELKRKAEERRRKREEEAKAAIE
jgi:coiled-coil domain-containing protein 55